MTAETVSILDGSTFLVSSANGDIQARPDEPHGLFFQDMRHLSRWNLLVNGKSVDVLSTDTLEYYFAQFFCVPPTGTIYKNPSLSVVRRRLVGDGMVEQLGIANHGTEAEQIELVLEADADFADLFEVKDALKKKGQLRREAKDGALVFSYQREDFVRKTTICASVPPTSVEENRLIFRLTLEPKTLWKAQVQVQPSVGEVTHQPKFANESNQAAAELRNSLKDWIEKAPAVKAYPDQLRMLYTRSLIDIAALRFQPQILPGHYIPAAGLPWFMALFGRDSIITSYQLLPFEPELAATTLRVLAASQGKTVDDFRDEEPGKILHELRFGELTYFHEWPQSPYYGTADATPLFLVLLDEYERWTGDAALVRQLKPNAIAALEWIDRYGDRDGDGYVEYERKKETGLLNQCWKDSWNSILFRDGTVAPLPRATCEIQGYVYDAKVRCARLAREVWGDQQLAARLENEAETLKRKFNLDFWVRERKFFALALDGKKKKVDSLTSNIGHLLWSGIVDEEKAPALADHLMGPALFSGWGVRTMAKGEGGYSPIEYHNGTVWPHDSIIGAAGLARYGFREEASRLVSGIFEAAPYFNYRLPEAFAGYNRDRTRFPVRYPTASSPQAWAAGSVMLGIRVLLGLEPSGEVLASSPSLPAWIGTLAVEGIPGRWGSETVVAEQKGAPSYKQILKQIIERRSTLEKEFEEAA